MLLNSELLLAAVIILLLSQKYLITPHTCSGLCRLCIYILCVTLQWRCALLCILYLFWFCVYCCLILLHVSMWFFVCLENVSAVRCVIYFSMLDLCGSFSLQILIVQKSSFIRGHINPLGDVRWCGNEWQDTWLMHFAFYIYYIVWLTLYDQASWMM